MSNPIVTRGLGSLLLPTGGYGDEGTVFVPETPSQRIPDFTTRLQSLFITQFRKERATPVTIKFVPVPEETGEGGNIITDYVEKAKTLFITQFRRNRD